MDAITAYDLSKRYGNRDILRELNLQVPQGTAAACIGRRGVGKTTFLRILSGLCRPTSGECSVLEASPAAEWEKVHRSVGIVLESAHLYKQLTLSENLRLFSGLFDLDENDALDRISFLLHRLDIWEGREIKVDDLPTDAVRKGMYARALLHRPKLLMIDDFSDGLDRETAESVGELLGSLQEEEGLTVFLCSEHMEYAQQLCNSFSILDQGKIIGKGTLEELRKKSGLPFYADFVLAEGQEPPAEMGFHLSEGRWRKKIDAQSDMPVVISQAVNAGLSIFQAGMTKPGLNAIVEACLNGGTVEPMETEQLWEGDGAHDDEQEHIAEPENGEESAVEGEEV